MRKSFVEKAMSKVKNWTFLDILWKYRVESWYIAKTDMETRIEYPTTLEDWVYNDFYWKEVSEYLLADHVAPIRKGAVIWDWVFSVSNKNVELLCKVVDNKCFTPLFTWMHFTEDWCIVGTDSFTLVEVKNCWHKHSFTVPKVIFSIMKDLDTSYVVYMLYENHVVFEVSWLEITQTLITGDYPDYRDERIMPKKEGDKKYIHIENKILSRWKYFLIEDSKVYVDWKHKTNYEIIWFDWLKLSKKSFSLISWNNVYQKQLEDKQALLYAYNNDVNIVTRTSEH